MKRGIPHAQETAYLVIDEHCRSKKPFIIAANLPLEKLQNPVGLERGEYAGILRDETNIVKFLNLK